MKSVREDIKNRTFRQAYLLYGEETYMLQQGKKDLIQALVPEGDEMNFARYEGKGVEVRALIDLCETMPFFAERRVILLEDTGFFKNKCEELADYLKSLPEYLVLIFVEEQVDKRSRMYKGVKEHGRIAEFTRLPEEQLLLWISALLNKNDRAITRRDAAFLYSMTGNDMANLRNEMEKLITYTMGRTQVTEEDIRAVCVPRIENRIFDMVRAVTQRDQKNAMKLYEELLTLREPPMRILFLMSRQYRQLLLVKRLEAEGNPPKEVARIAGVPSFALRTLSACAASYTQEGLERILEAYAAQEEAVKTGRLQDSLAVELLLVQGVEKSK